MSFVELVKEMRVFYEINLPYARSHIDALEQHREQLRWMIDRLELDGHEALADELREIIEPDR